MNDQELLYSQEKLEELYNLIEQQVNPEIMNLINEYSNLQIEVEKECNK